MWAHIRRSTQSYLTNLQWILQLATCLDLTSMFVVATTSSVSSSLLFSLCYHALIKVFSKACNIDTAQSNPQFKIEKIKKILLFLSRLL